MENIGSGRQNLTRGRRNAAGEYWGQDGHWNSDLEKKKQAIKKTNNTIGGEGKIEEGAGQIELPMAGTEKRDVQGADSAEKSVQNC